MKRSELISILKELDTEIDALTEQRDAAQAEVEALGPVREVAAWGWRSQHTLPLTALLCGTRAGASLCPLDTESTGR